MGRKGKIHMWREQKRRWCISSSKNLAVFRGFQTKTFRKLTVSGPNRPENVRNSVTVSGCQFGQVSTGSEWNRTNPVTGILFPWNLRNAAEPTVSVPDCSTWEINWLFLFISLSLSAWKLFFVHDRDKKCQSHRTLLKAKQIDV
jgi:hypothetical protein